MNREGVEVDKESKKKTTKLHSLVIRHVMTDSLPNVARGSATLVIHPKEPVLKVMCVSLFHPSPLDCDDNLRCAQALCVPPQRGDRLGRCASGRKSRRRRFCSPSGPASGAGSRRRRALPIRRGQPEPRSEHDPLDKLAAADRIQ